MDPVSVIVAALAAGAAKGVGETASAAVADAYRGLKALLGKVFGANPKADTVLAEHESDPGTWQAPLVKLLTDSDAAKDEQVLAAAQRLLKLADPAGDQAGKYTIDARGANIGAIGDVHHQQNAFGAPLGDR